MLRKIIGLFIMFLVSMFSFSLAVNVNQGNFGQSDKTAGVGVAGTGTDQGEGFIDVIKGFINWVLGILALIALIVLLLGGFQMITAAGDEGKYKKGFTILKQAVIGLIFIGVSWFIVSLIFTVIGGVVK